EGWKMWAGDGQAGTVLKAYREHLVSPDDAFLKRNWPRIRKTLEFLINEDGNADGLLEGAQHNTYDINFFGANTMVGSLYLAALRAAEEMARERGDREFAVKCRTIFESGKKLSVERLFNGEYFVQDVDLEEHPKDQYGEGCLSDHLFGQGWAHQVGLGYIYPKETVLQALQSIWKYNWAPDIARHNQAHPPERWFVQPGEAGLFTCTWPKSPHLAQGVRYRDEVWTGIEYQVAGNMAYDGMVTEALAICRAIHDRYHPSKHNPWNEVECGDHYARGMASHGVFLALCGFEYHGPKGHLGFAPRIRPDQFRAAFTAAEGWGTLSQQRSGGRQVSAVEVNWGRLRLNSVALELADGTARKAAATLNGTPLAARTEQEGARLLVTFAEETVLEAEARLEIAVS
ncbi:MAG: GH116 family glycosyl hydrolase, partial [Planctomycetota bacterium]|nr:GH116 family glycosyl hydrolase [Planctomycetota bacterium]